MATNEDARRIGEAHEVYADFYGAHDTFRVKISKVQAKKLVASTSGFGLLDLEDDGGSVLLVVPQAN